MAGSYPKFNAFDVLRVFLKIEKDNARVTLVKDTGIGEGTMRTILNLLKDKRLITSNRQGHSLTKKGQLLKDELSSIVESSEFKDDKIFSGKRKFVFWVKKPDHNKPIYEERDIAVKNGADAALIFGYDNRLRLPGMEKFDTRKLENLFPYQKGDILLMIASVDENPGLAVVSELNSKLKEIMTTISR